MRGREVEDFEGRRTGAMGVSGREPPGVLGEERIEEVERQQEAPIDKEEER